METSERMRAEVVVVGGGPAGLTAAIALASAGVETVLVAPPHRPDNRTTALLAGSVAALDALGVWPHCRDEAAPLRAIRLIDDRGGLLRAPEVTFDANEIGFDAFGHNIENRALLAALARRAAELPALRIVAATADNVDCGERHVTLRLSNGQRVEAWLGIGADGRNSRCREAAGIAADAWSYPQTALTCNLAHGREHENISTEFHTASGPFTLVPLPGRRSSLVWAMAPAEAARIAGMPTDHSPHPEAAAKPPSKDGPTAALRGSTFGRAPQGEEKEISTTQEHNPHPEEAAQRPSKDGQAPQSEGDDALSLAIERQSHSILGKVQVEGERGLFPLTGLTARTFAANRIALVGEAAHVIPPIGAQGFNLGLRDAATIAELVVRARRAGDDAGSDDVLGDYNARRRADIGTRTLAVDLLNRSLLSDFLPLQGLRGLGLQLVNRIGPLRRAMMREGVTPRLAEPALMRGEAL